MGTLKSNLEESDEPPDPLKNRRSGWRKLIRDSISNPEEISNLFGLDLEETKEVCSKYPVRIPRYYLSLIKKKDDGIYRQCIPDILEIRDKFGYEDPLNEEGGANRGVVPRGITHRYPDRVLFIVSNQCAMYCRFCTRKRKVGDPKKQRPWRSILEGIDYIKSHPEIRDVILSGGDPLMLTDKALEQIIKRIRKISHVEIIRIGTRMPCTLPQRITKKLCKMLKKYHPIYVNTHFNHPDEITPESEEACQRLVDFGIPVGCQTVLLKGINDDVLIMRELMKKLIKIRVKPYYIYMADPVLGTNHLRTRVKTGLDIIHGIRGYISGLCVPHFVIDAPGGGGKVPILPEYVQEINDDKVIMKNYLGKRYEYLQTDFE